MSLLPSRRSWMPLMLAMAFAAPAHAAKPDIAAEWRDFLAKAKADEVYPAFSIVVDLIDGQGDISEAACRENADAIAQAVRVVPVSAAVNFAAYRCAELLGDDAAAEKHGARYAAIASHALAMASEDWMDRPIPVVGGSDIYTILRGAGLELRYERLDPYSNRRHAKVRVAVWDTEAKIEREFSFDYLDVVMQLNRDKAAVAYPGARTQYWRQMVRSMAEGRLLMGIDLAATLESFGDRTPQERAAILRPAAEQGGLQSTLIWMSLCRRTPFDGCGEGVIDALLPHVEENEGMHTVLLAMAYADGVGVARDDAAAGKMLAKASEIMGRSRAVVAFAKEYQVADPRPFPAFITSELEALAAQGNPYAKVILASRASVGTEGNRLPEPFIQSLQAPAKAGVTSATRMLGLEYFIREEYDKAVPLLRSAAEAGDARSQDLYARLLYDGSGVPRDQEAATHWFRLAAIGGDDGAMVAMSGDAMVDGDVAAAEQWLINAADFGNDDAATTLAGHYLRGTEGMTGDRKRGLAILGRIDNAEARRMLAYVYMDKDAAEHDVAKAEALLRQDAEKGDLMSALLLGLGWLEGTLGKVDEAAGMRWLDKGLKEKDDDTVDAYATHLYYRGGSAEARQRALVLWREQLAHQADSTVSNNFAWALCTSNDPAVLDGTEGLRVAKGMGKPDDLPSSQIDTVASCYAAAGDFKEAERIQRLAVETREEAMGADAEGLEGMRKRQALYGSGKAFIEVERE